MLLGNISKTCRVPRLKSSSLDNLSRVSLVAFHMSTSFSRAVQNNKGWQSAAARNSEDAALQIEAALQHQAAASNTSGTWWTLGSLAAIGILSAVSVGTEGGLLALVQHPHIMAALAWLRHSPAGDAAADAASQGLAAVHPYLQQAAAAAEPYASAAAALAAPAAAQLRGVLAPGYEVVKELMVPRVQQAGQALSGVVDKVAFISTPFLQQAAGLLGFAANTAAAS